MLPELTTAQTVAALAATAVSLLTVAGVMLGWFGKAWRWLVALVSKANGTRRELLFFVDQLRGAFWSPAKLGDGRPALQFMIFLEASNMTDGAYRIMNARMRGYRAINAHILVQDLKSGMYGHNYPIPAKQIAPASANFTLETPPPAKPDTVIKATLVLTDHLGKEHSIRVALKGPKA